MTDKVQKIKDWISKEQDGLMDAQGNFENPSDEGAFHILSNLDYYIDSLQENPVSEELEDAVNAYIGYAPEVDESSSVYGKRQAFKAGAQWQKEQLMKDAVYGLVCGHDESSPAWIDLNLLNKPNVKVGTEIKLIIIKDE